MEEVGVGRRRGAFVSGKRRRQRGAAGGGASPTAPSRAWEALGQQRLGTQGNNGDCEGPHQTKALQAPPLASLPSSRCCASLPPRRLGRGLAWGWGEGLGRTPCDTPTHMCDLAFLQVPQQSRNLPPSSLCRLGSLQRLPDAQQGSTKDQGLAKSALRCKGNRPQILPGTERDFPGQGCVSCSGALPTVERETEALGKEGHAGGEEALRPAPHWPLRLHPGFTLHCQALLDGAQVVHGARPFGTALFLMLLHWRKSPCSFQRV